MRRVLIAASLWLALTAPALGKFYSIQLVTTNSYGRAEAFLKKLPPAIRRKAFVYRTDSGYYTVRYLVSPTVGALREKVTELEELGIKSYSFVETDVKKLRGAGQKPHRQVSAPSVPEKPEESRQGHVGLDFLYSVYLGNGDLKGALKVAQLAVKRHPNSLKWWKRLATVAVWLNRPKVALRAYRELVFRFHRYEYARPLYSVALAVGDFETALKSVKFLVASGEGNVDYTDIVDLFHRVGRPEEGADFLVEHFSDNPDALHLAFNIYWYRGELQKALKVLDLIQQRFGLSPEDRLAKARLLFAMHRLKEALATLKEEWRKVNSVDYLNTLESLSWSLGDFKTAVEVAERLIELDKADETDFTRVIYYYYYREPERAVKYAKLGFDKFGKPDFFANYLFLLASLKQWGKVVESVDSLPDRLRRRLLADPTIGLTYASALVKLGEKERARRLLFSYLSGNPSPDVLAELIYLSIDMKDYPTVESLVRRYKDYCSQVPEAFAAAYLFLQNGKKALKCFSLIKTKNPNLLLTEADALELYGDVRRAWTLRFRVYNYTKKLLKKGVRSPDVVEAYLRSSIFYQPADRFEREFLRFKRYLSKEIARDIYLTYLLYKGRESETAYLWKRKGEELAPWMKLTLALYWEDRYLMNRLVKLYLPILPIRDRVTALEEVGEFGRAFWIAVKGMDENPRDAELMKQFRDLVVDKASHYYLELTDYGVKGVNLLSLSQDLRLHLTGNYYLNVKDTFRYDISRGNVFDTKRGLNRISVGLERLLDYNRSLFAGVTVVRGGSHTLGGGYLGYTAQLWHQSTATLTLFKGELTDESFLSSLGVVRRGAQFEFTFPFYNRLSLFTSLSYNRYYSLDGSYVGNSRKLYTELSFQERSQYPDYKFRLFLNLNSYYETDHTGTYVDRLSGKERENVLPSGFYSLGVGVNWGFDHRDSFIKSWRPYFDGSVSYNSQYGADCSLVVGVGGRLTRKDNFHVELGTFNSFNALNSWGWILSSGYRRWF